MTKDDEYYNIINNLFEKSLLYIDKFPSIWLLYLSFLKKQNNRLKLFINVFNRSLKILPITQHKYIWNVYLEYINSTNIQDLIIDAYSRYLKIDEDIREEYINILINYRKHDLLVDEIITILNKDMFYSNSQSTKYDYWILLCEIITINSGNLHDININNKYDFELIIRQGLSRYIDEVGKLWVSLANISISNQDFNKARIIFEEALAKVSNKRDFIIIYNAYLKFEEELINLDNDNSSSLDIDDNKDIDNLLDNHFEKLNINDDASNNEQPLSKSEISELKVKSKLFNIKSLMERRAFMLSDLELRLNPNNILEWLNRVELCSNNQLKMKIYEEAINNIDLENININKKFNIGKVEDLWINYAKFTQIYYKDLKYTNLILMSASKNELLPLESRINVILEWCEIHIKNNNINSAADICNYGIKLLTKIDVNCNNTSSIYINNKIKNSNIVQLFLLSIDLQIYLDNVDNVINLYEIIINLQIADVNTILNYCSYLIDNNYTTNCFKLLEQIISNNMFVWPQLYDIWLMYIKYFTEHCFNVVNKDSSINKHIKIERLKDIYEQILSTCPDDKAKLFYYKYTYLEEDYGLHGNCIKILHKGIERFSETKSSAKYDVIEMYSVLISLTAKYFGLVKTRNIFVKALDTLDKSNVVDIGVKYALIERRLGEIERARAIFEYLSQFCNPSNNDYLESFWLVWDEFELYHGNENTYKDMLRIKRNVANKYSLTGDIKIID